MAWPTGPWVMHAAAALNAVAAALLAVFGAHHHACAAGFHLHHVANASTNADSKWLWHCATSGDIVSACRCAISAMPRLTAGVPSGRTTSAGSPRRLWV